MSYLVLARKYRPQIFDDVIAQDNIVEKLAGAVESGRLASGYLFCGPRGVGKTSCARILAKSLNCEKGPTKKPCGKCAACVEIAKGSSFDVLEIDGASNRGIDEIRTLRENVKFSPSYGRYKIYIVDEVHMLTNEAFNALLKTLEEPPEHVIFIFATTAPNKVPATIVSRCQRFDFKRIPTKEIAAALTDVCKEEKLKSDEDALFSIAKAAKGGLRDALSVLDQISASSSKKIVAEDVNSMLGIVETEYLFSLADAIADKDGVKALKVLEDIIDKGKDVKQLVKDIIEHFRNLMIVKIGAHSLGKLIDYPNSVKDSLLEQSLKFELKNIIFTIDMLINVQETARITETIHLPLEVAIAKLTYSSNIQEPKESLISVEKVEDENSKLKGQSPIETLKNERGQIDISGKEDSVKEESEDLNIEKIQKAWDSLTHAITKEKMTVATYLQEGVPVEWDDNVLTIAFEPRCLFNKESLERPKNIEIVQNVFTKELNVKVVIRYRIEAGVEDKLEDPQVSNMLNTFGGEVVNKWHNE